MSMFRRPPLVGRRRQAGLTTLTIVMLLFLAMGITVLYANRSLLFEQKTSANQYRSTQAFEVAEAGIEWALANINNQRVIGTDCLPLATPVSGAVSFKRYYTQTDTTTGLISPTGRRAACVITSSGYSCSCPTSGNPTASAVGPSFSLEFVASTQPGLIQLTAYGCTDTGAAAKDGRCLPGGTGTSDAYARITTLIGLLPAISTPPAAAITAKTTVNWTGTGAALGVVNTDPATNGITINAGGEVNEESARIVTLPGSPPTSSIIENDTSLATLSDDAMFQTYMGMTKAEYRSLATEVTCSGNCTSALEAAIAGGAQTLWVNGDMDIQSNVTLGSDLLPIVLVVDGNITLNGTMDVIGLVYSTALTWNNTGGGSAFLRGAAVAEGGFTGNGTPDFYYDADVLRRLALDTGAFAKIPGSWRDF